MAENYKDGLIDLAKSYNGYLGKKTNSNLYDFKENANGKYNMFAYELDAQNFYNGNKNGYDWCAVFYDWLFFTTFGLDVARNMLYRPSTGNLSAGVKYAAQYFKNNSAFYTTPEPGDQIFFGTTASWNHTGIVTSVEDGYVCTVEGNSQATFDGTKYSSTVAKFKYPLTYNLILGYGRPNWTVSEESNEPEQFPQEQFDAMMDNWLSRHSINLSIVNK